MIISKICNIRIERELLPSAITAHHSKITYDLLSGVVCVSNIEKGKKILKLHALTLFFLFRSAVLTHALTQTLHVRLFV